MYRGIHNKQEKKQILEEVARIFVNDLSVMNNLLLSIYDYVISPYQSHHLGEGLFQYLDEIADEMMASLGCLIAYDESNLIRCKSRAVVKKSVFKKGEQVFEV